jgi:uncharacterized membrane-anchored protein YhcB (DUF1043 family)
MNVELWVGIAVAILAPGGIIVTLIERTRRENNRDHAKNSDLLQKIDNKIDRLDERVDDHISWHLDKDR